MSTTMDRQPKRTVTMTMNFDGLVPDDDDEDADFFDSTNRISAVVPIDFGALPSSDDESDDDFDDPRLSFTSISGEPEPISRSSVSIAGPPPPVEEYNMWMAAPGSIHERRRRLLQDMGLNSNRNLLQSNKNLLRVRTMAMSKKFNKEKLEKSSTSSSSSSPSAPPLPPKKREEDGHDIDDKEDDEVDDDQDNQSESQSPSGDTPVVLVRSRSDGDMHPFSAETKKRKEEMIGNVSKQRLTRTSSTLAPFIRVCNAFHHGKQSHTHNENSNTNNTNNNKNDTSNTNSNDSNSNATNAKATSGRTKTHKKGKGRKSSQSSNNQQQQQQSGQLGAFFLIKNLDTGKEFVVKEFAEDGMWNRLSDLQTGRQMTMEEFEKSVGYSPVVKELMRRQGVARKLDGGGDPGGGTLERKTSVNAYLSKSFRYSKRRGVSLVKNITKVANSVVGAGAHPEKETTAPQEVTPPKGGKGGANNNNNNNNNNNGASQNPEWVRARTQGKTYRELTALRFCQEIQAHEGSIWTIKFNVDGRYLASAGEDKVIHIWEVQECEIASLMMPDEAGNGTPVHPMHCPSPDRPPLAPDLSTLEKKKKGKSASRRGSSMPDYVKLPDTVFSLSNEPVCSFEGHLDDVLDISWSRSQLHLLSSSMDKTVRLWDLETRTCLKLFAHNDYVTCIQFNPVNDNYFISGSLDAKVRIWSVPGRRVVDWTDLHEMVTATCYTPDGQGAAVGSHKGNCRMYSIDDGKLTQKSQFDIQNKKKSALKKITGFEFNVNNPEEVLVTSADSRVRIYEGSEVIQKFRGFRNTSSQIAASYSPDGKYVICASEDSNVYVWKKEEHKNGKTKTVIDTRSYEHFQCKDVSVAIPWPGSLKLNPPTVQLNSKRNSKRITAPLAPTCASNSPKKEEANKNSKRQLPPLPNNKKGNNTTEKTDKSNTSENSNNENNVDEEKAPNSPEEDPARITRSESVNDSSFSSNTGSSIRYGDSPSITSSNATSPSMSPGRSWFDGGGTHGHDMQATAWGLVIVTAGLGGEIRAYQNFGIPVRVGRQAPNLFKDLA